MAEVLIVGSLCK